MDDPFVLCPYDKKHRVPQSRIQGHIIKCMKKYPIMSICPYNATHRYPADQIKAHVEHCPMRFQIFPEEKPTCTGSLTIPKQILQSEYISEKDPNHEIWDD